MEAGGADLILIYNSGRFRMAGHGSLAGLMPYSDANKVVVEMVCLCSHLKFCVSLRQFKLLVACSDPLAGWHLHWNCIPEHVYMQLVPLPVAEIYTGPPRAGKHN